MPNLLQLRSSSFRILGMSTTLPDFRVVRIPNMSIPKQDRLACLNCKHHIAETEDY